ncbi:MAG: hypothetical protein C4520_06205 [Candidatus Abyssobacteria bacterium SURF_5]|uniref:Transmembrane protein n=1 Tax=Abyssobacteria bacterium (strain SURF_5) TaxID=2093360 RepID=A0A3A4NSM9_ABYX5|nr:MAG: hypothetical protein C4520_06205 [Candidatus Abyssubacteria bacterium SURF_5]
MKKLILVVTLALLMIGMTTASAPAKDEFESGFKTELGAIAARSAVGVGVGVFNGIFGGGVAYNGVYATPVPVYRPYYQERIVYAPPPPPPPVYYRVERRHYVPYGPPGPPPRRVVHHHEHHHYYH